MLPNRRFAAFLFDMDGTILSSIANAERHWGAWAMRHGLDVASFLPTIHGIQSVETIRRLALPGLDPVAEAAAITRAEIDDMTGIEEIAGAGALLAVLPPERWTIVTSAPRELAAARLAHVGLPMPASAVTAEDVARSKPAPDGFLLAAERLGVPIGDCLAFEDAPAGIAAAHAAGATVMVMTATHQHLLDTPHPTMIDYTDVDLAAAAWLELRARP